MKDFLKSNLFYALVSVFLAVLLMFYVDSLSIPPSSEKTFTDLTLAVNNLPEGMIVENEMQDIDLRVRGYTTTINSTSAKDFRVWVDLKEAQPGSETYRVQTSMPSGLELVWIRPSTLSLTVDTLGEKTMSLRVQTQNNVAEGYSSNAPTVNPTQITLSGPQLLLDQVASAVVTVDVNGLTEDYSVELPVVLYDNQGERIEDERLSLSDATVWVGVKVSENKASKSVAVRPAFSGEPQEQYKTGGVEVEPSTVRIAGSYDLIKEIEYLNTEPIDLTEATADYTVEAPLVIPEGIEVLEGGAVQVTVRIEENLTYRVIQDIPVEILNGPEGSVYTSLPATVDMTLAAYPWVFDRDSDGEGGYNIPVRVFVDLKGEEPGGESQQLLTQVPEDYQVAELSVDTVQVVS